MKMTVIPIEVAARSPQRFLVRGLEKLETWERAETIQIVNWSQKTQKSLRDLRKIAVTQTPQKDHQQTLVWKIHHNNNNNNNYNWMLNFG